MWPTIISGAVSLFTSFFKGEGVSKAAGTTNGLILYGAIAAGVVWFFNGAEAWHTTLNGRELVGCVVGGSLLLEWFRKMHPPNP